MIIGVPKEIKVAEQRIALTPAGARFVSQIVSFQRGMIPDLATLRARNSS